MKKILFISLLAISLFSVSCTDEVGGNADLSTVDLTVHSDEWKEYGTIGEAGYGFYVDIDMPEITENVLQYGMVNLYVKSGEAWIPVPMTVFHDGYQGGFIYSFKRSVLSIDYYESDFKTVRPDTRFFRLIIVQPI